MLEDDILMTSELSPAVFFLMSKDTKLIQTRILLGTSGCVLFYVATPEQYQVGPLQCFEALVPIAPAGPQQHFVASQ